MKFDNKIEAIKALRIASCLTGHLEWNCEKNAYVVVIRDTSGIERHNGIGLKEAKDIIEAAMELGIQQAQVNELRNERIRMEDFLRDLSAQLQTEANLLEAKRMGRL